MKKKVLGKLRGQAGETITETLLSVLVAALALVMLAGAVSSGSRAIQKSRSKLDRYYRAAESVVKRDSSAEGVGYTTESGTVTIRDQSVGAAIEDQSFGVTLYYNSEFSQNPVIAYKKSD